MSYKNPKFFNPTRIWILDFLWYFFILIFLTVYKVNFLFYESLSSLIVWICGFNPIYWVDYPIEPPDISVGILNKFLLASSYMPKYSEQIYIYRNISRIPAGVIARVIPPQLDHKLLKFLSFFLFQRKNGGSEERSQNNNPKYIFHTDASWVCKNL